jgi:hypothetical protein
VVGEKYRERNRHSLKKIFVFVTSIIYQKMMFCKINVMFSKSIEVNKTNCASAEFCIYTQFSVDSVILIKVYLKFLLYPISNNLFPLYVYFLPLKKKNHDNNCIVDSSNNMNGTA